MTLRPTRKLMKACCIALFALNLNSHATTTPEAKGCQNGCILLNRSEDQDCHLENSPLTRCENFNEFKKEDARLNNEYKKLSAKIGVKDKKMLLQPQREWIRWRDEQCELEDVQANCTNGICAGVEHDNCILSLTARRADELERFNDDIGKAKASGFRFSKEGSEVH